MSFKLTIEIKDDATTQVDFDGTVNHIVLLGVLESVKHGILGTADIMAAQDVLSPNEDGNGEGAQAPSLSTGD
jgi:hypothetical protein